MIEVKKTRICDVYETLKPMFDDHWNEIANYKDSVPLEVNYERLLELEVLGKTLSIIMTEDEEIIGYSMFIISSHLHYKSLITAANDVLFLRKDKRNSGLGMKLIKDSEQIVKEYGARKITWHVKPHMDFTPLLKKLGYTHEEYIYGKLLY